MPDTGPQAVEATGWAAAANAAPVTRLEGADKVSGRARYTTDVRLPGMLWACALRSPHPHARVRRIDARGALALRGVHAVMSCEDAPDIGWYDRGKLFDRTVRFVGDEVAVVAAESEELAAQAVARIHVDYEPLPFVLDLARALVPDAPSVHGTERNRVDAPAVEQRGNVRKGMREAELIIDRVYSTQSVLHNALEPHGCVAVWDHDFLTLYASTQGIFALRCEVADKLGLPQALVRVITEHMGGGFGAKQVAWKQDVLAALLARLTGRPVRMVLDREAENVAVGNRNATRQHLRIGATREGQLTAICATIDVQIGAYRAGGEGSIVDGIYHTLYACRNVRTEQSVVYTHTAPSIAFRAPGYVEGCFALESALDELARALNIDPIELRLRNYTEFDQRKKKPYTLPDGLRRCYAKSSETFGWARYRRAPEDGPKRRGIGVAAHDWLAGAGGPSAKVRLELGEGERFKLVTGTQDIGTGTRTVLAQICAEALGVSVGRIDVALGDTAAALPAPVSSGSSTLPSLAPAVHDAGRALREALLRAAADMSGHPYEALAVSDAGVVGSATDAPPVSFESIRAHVGRRGLQASAKRQANKRSHAIRTCGVQCVEVEVDVETGAVRVLRVVATHECGRIVNTALADSQVIGGVMQGIGYALMERRLIDPGTGRALNANLEDYKIPTVQDAPDIVHAALDLPDALANGVGVKGLGEPPIIPTAPAIANAIFDAVGVRIYDLPVDRCAMLEVLGGPPRPRLCDRREPS